eukprot:934650-Prymnesium_polylepis.1
MGMAHVRLVDLRPGRPDRADVSMGEGVLRSRVCRSGTSHVRCRRCSLDGAIRLSARTVRHVVKKTSACASDSPQA